MRGDGEAAAARGDDGGAGEHLGQRLWIERCRHHHDAQILAQRLLSFDAKCQPEIGIQAALVKLIEDHATHAAKRRIRLQHAGQNAFSEHLDARIAAHFGFEPGAVADGVSDRFSEQRRHAIRDRACGETPRFEHQDPAALEPRAVQQQQGHEGAFTGAWRCFQQHTAAILQRGDELRHGL